MFGKVINQLGYEVQNSGHKSIQWNAANYQGQPPFNSFVGFFFVCGMMVRFLPIKINKI